MKPTENEVIEILTEHRNDGPLSRTEVADYLLRREQFSKYEFSTLQGYAGRVLNQAVLAGKVTKHSPPSWANTIRYSIKQSSYECET